MYTKQEILALRDEQILEMARQLRIPYQLKRTMRYGTERDQTVHNESVGEHEFAFFYLLQFFLPLEDPSGRLNLSRIIRLIVYHDFGEIPNGDKPYHLKTKEDEEREKADAVKVFASLPPLLQHIGLKSWQEYEERKTPEAKFVYALDKVEPMFELMDPIAEKSLKRMEFSYEDHIGKKMRATEGFPVMRRFVEVVSADMLRRDVFWKKPAALEIAS
jgi:5'-deoxynucleotidase YfbR-like HD superfamily hydrolase